MKTVDFIKNAYNAHGKTAAYWGGGYFVGGTMGNMTQGYTLDQSLLMAVPPTIVFCLALPLALDLEKDIRSKMIRDEEVNKIIKPFSQIGTSIACMVFSSYVTMHNKQESQRLFDIENGNAQAKEIQVTEPTRYVFDTNVQDTFVNKPNRIAFPVAQLTQ